MHVSRLFVLGLFLLPVAVQAQTVGDPARPGDLQQDILSALKAGTKQVTVTPGRYVMPAPKEWATLLFVNLSDVVLDFTGVDLSLTSSKDGIGFVRCTNVALSRGVCVCLLAMQIMCRHVLR